LAAQKANAGKRVYVRSGFTKECQNPACEESFYVTATTATRRFCSQACMGVMMVKSRMRACSVCGVVFLARTPGIRPKTCSEACRREAGRRAKFGKRNPNYTGARSRATAVWLASIEDACRVCGGDDRLRRHHVVYEQHVRKHKGDHWDPDDSLTVCFDCHGRHHNGSDMRIHVHQLRAENVRFAADLLGDYAQDYFVRYYDGSRCEILDLIAAVTREEALCEPNA
jgi:hypothetical protein